MTMMDSSMLHNCSSVFFFNDTATTEIYTLSLHDALPICEELVVREEGRTPHALGREVDQVGEIHRLGGAGWDTNGRRPSCKVGKGHLRTPATPISCLPSSAWKKKHIKSYNPKHPQDHHYI